MGPSRGARSVVGDSTSAIRSRPRPTRRASYQRNASSDVRFRIAEDDEDRFEPRVRAFARASGQLTPPCYLGLVNARAKKIREEALELPTKARAKLAHDLILSLEGEPLESPEDVEKAWAAEINRRIEDVKEGRAKLIPADQALRSVRASLRRSRAQRAR